MKKYKYTDLTKSGFWALLLYQSFFVTANLAHSMLHKVEWAISPFQGIVEGQTRQTRQKKKKLDLHNRNLS